MFTIIQMFTITIIEASADNLRAKEHVKFKPMGICQAPSHAETPPSTGGSSFRVQCLLLSASESARYNEEALVFVLLITDTDLFAQCFAVRVKRWGGANLTLRTSSPRSGWRFFPSHPTGSRVKASLCSSRFFFSSAWLCCVFLLFLLFC